jgi:hypothetical protein
MRTRSTGFQKLPPDRDQDDNNTKDAELMMS